MARDAKAKNIENEDIKKGIAIAPTKKEFMDWIEDMLPGTEEKIFKGWKYP